MKIYGSKKATLTVIGIPVIPTIVGVVVVMMTNAGVETDIVKSVSEALAWGLAALLGLWNISQGLADFGKEAKK